MKKPFQSWQIKEKPFPKSLARCILNTYKHSIKNLKQGKVVQGVYLSTEYPGKIERYSLGIEKYLLKTGDPRSWTIFFSMRKVKKLEVMIGPIDKLKDFDMKEWRFLRHLLISKSLKALIINYDLRRQCHDDFYRMILNLNKLPTFLQSLKEFKIIIPNNSNNGGLPIIESDTSNTFRYITSIEMMTYYSRFFLDNTSQFINLISLQTNLYSDGVDDKSEYCTEKFFTGLQSLKTLKHLELKVDPNRYSSSIQQIIQDFLQNFTLPESLEILTLKLDCFKLSELRPQIDNKAFFMQENNSLEYHKLLREFAEKWKTFFNLKGIDIEITDRSNQSYVVNRNLMFLILNRVPKVEKIRYYHAVYGKHCDEPRPPLDFGLFLQSIQHLSPHLTHVIVDEDDWGVAVKNNFQVSEIYMPRLKEFKVGRQILGGKFFLDLPRMMFKNSLKHNENINITLGCLLLQNDEDFGALLKSLANIPKFPSVKIDVNAWYLNPGKITQYLCDFLENAKPEGSVTLYITHAELFSKAENHKIRRRLLARAVFKQFRLRTRHSFDPVFNTSEGSYLRYKIAKSEVKKLKIVDYWEKIDFL